MINDFTLNNNRTKLKKVEEADFEFIYNLYNDYDYSMLWTNLREFSSKVNFLEFLEYKINNEFSYYFIIQTIKGFDIGTIYIYDYNKIDNYAYISLYIIPEFQNKFYAIDAFLLIFKFISKYLPIRKLYLDVMAYNKKSLSIIKKVNFQQEGEFKKHKYYNGKYYDMHRFSIFLEDWRKLSEKYEKLPTTRK